MDTNKNGKILQFIYETIPFIKFLLYCIFIYNVGLFKGLLLSYFFKLSYDFSMKKIFKLEPFAPGDLLFVWNNEEENYNLILAMIFENMNIEAIKNIFIDISLSFLFLDQFLIIDFLIILPLSSFLSSDNSSRYS